MSPSDHPSSFQGGGHNGHLVHRNIIGPTPGTNGNAIVPNGNAIVPVPGYDAQQMMMQGGYPSAANPYGNPHGHPGVPHQFQQHQEIQELKNGMHTVLRRMETQNMALHAQLQMGQKPQPIIIQNHAQSTTEQKVEAPQPAPQNPDDQNNKVVGLAGFLFDVYWDLKKFFRSPFNRMCLVGSVGFGFYVYQQHLSHQWRMNEMQRRIDANLVLKMSQWVSGQIQQVQ